MLTLRLTLFALKVFGAALPKELLQVVVAKNGESEFKLCRPWRCLLAQLQKDEVLDGTVDEIAAASQLHEQLKLIGKDWVDTCELQFSNKASFSHITITELARKCENQRHEAVPLDSLIPHVARTITPLSEQDPVDPIVRGNYLRLV